MNQHHPNRLDATRKTGRFWEYLRRAFAGVLSSNQRNQNKPPKLTKLTMTNSQESDSIPEKPEVVKTEPKSNRWNWKTATIAVTLTATVNAISLASAIIQTIRQRLNQWNWRQKTALVTALAITAVGNFVYQYKANAAWPAVIAAAYGTDFFVKLFTGYAITQGLNAAFNTAILKETAIADTDTWLFSKRKYYRRDYSYDGSTTTTDVRVDATAEALQDKTYDASGTDSRYSPSTLDADDVLDYYVNHNTHLDATTEEYQILNDGEPLYFWSARIGNHRKTLQTFAFSYGGYVQKLTTEEIQEELDDMRDDWNRYNRGMRYRRPVRVGKLTLGPKVSQVDKKFECEREVKLWSDFEHVPIPGGGGLSPTELEEQGSRSTYVTRLSYIAREAGYGPYYGMVVTKVPRNERPRHDYPEPLSYTDDNFKRFGLTQIPWSSFKIIGTPTWVGRAERHFKHKKIYQWCLTHNTKHPPGRRGHRSTCRHTTKHEYPVYQNENVKKTSN